MGFRPELSKYIDYETNDPEVFDLFAMYSLMQTDEDSAEKICMVIVQSLHDSCGHLQGEVGEAARYAYEHDYDYIVVELIDETEFVS